MCKIFKKRFVLAVFMVIVLSMQYISNVFAGVYSYANGYSDVYAGPSNTGYSRIGSVNNEHVYLMFKEGEWGYISYQITSGSDKGKSKGGYVKLGNLKEQNAESRSMSSQSAESNSNQYVYTGTSGNHVAVGSISKGESIIFLGLVDSESGRCFIEYKVDGTSLKKRGWIPTNQVTIVINV